MTNAEFELGVANREEIIAEVMKIAEELSMYSVIRLYRFAQLFKKQDIKARRLLKK